MNYIELSSENAEKDILRLAEMISGSYSPDAVVFVSPIYYYDINAQLKTAIDRFYASNAQIQTPKKAALLLTSGDAEWDVTAGAIGTYKGICGYLGWSDAGIIAAGGCGVLEEIKQTEFPQKAYLLGKNFGA